MTGGALVDATPAKSCAEIYEEQFEFVWRNARRFGVPDDVCEDVVHDVFLVAQRRLGQFEGRSSIRTWLYGILARVVLEHRRGERQRLVKESHAAAEMAAEAPAAEGPAEALARKEAARLVDGILTEMDAEKRAIFVLVDLEEVGVPDAARGLEINLNTAYARLRAARGIFTEAVKRMHAQSAHADTASRFWWRRR